ncbi:MAG: HAD superfamily hydrolase (TIGR01549 family), partial [Litorivivens sp.]
MKKTLVIFDFDGVIVDSLGFLYQTYLDFLAEFGVEGNEKEFDLLNGPKLAQIITYLKDKYQLVPSEQELFNNYLGRMSKLYDEVGLFEGIEDSFAWLRNADCKIALASSCGRAEIDKVFSRFNLGHYFDFIATGDDVSKAKPEPDIYVLAKSQFSGYQALVLEDSENGVQAAASAGLKTVLFNPRNVSFPINTDYEIQAHEGLRSLVAEMGLSCVTIAKADDIVLQLVEEGISFSTDQLDQIEAVWKEELKRKQLFNGGIISYKSHEIVDGQLRIKCFLVEYKQFLAQLKSANLDLGIAPIGVSAIIIDADDNTLLGVRNN